MRVCVCVCLTGSTAVHSAPSHLHTPVSHICHLSHSHATPQDRGLSTCHPAVTRKGDTGPWGEGCLGEPYTPLCTHTHTRTHARMSMTYPHVLHKLRAWLEVLSVSRVYACVPIDKTLCVCVYVCVCEPMSHILTVREVLSIVIVLS